ncbi:MAG: hypothetical protein GC190_22035 [Alphaproteobacteria bacterium]|nr:hypothetical protein [Alphaproteobacteria bacterium]
MHPGRIAGANAALGQPKNWNATIQGRVITLHVRKANTNAGPVMQSAWLPTLEEIEAIRAGAPVILTIVGEVHPPVGVSVGEAPKADQSDSPFAG